MEEFEAQQIAFTTKGDRVVAFCGHTHRTKKAAQACVKKLARRDDHWLWFARPVQYLRPSGEDQ